MDFLQRIGGRKFLMALIVVGVAVGLELSGKGLTPTMAGFLASVVGLFSAANYATTARHMETKGGGSSQLDTVLSKIEQANDPEKVKELISLLTSMQEKLSTIEFVSGQTGHAVVNLGQLLTRK